MSTNFYWKKEQSWMKEYTDEILNFEEDDINPIIHIGKRSAAGEYCEKCGVTLCKGGEREVHFSNTEWYKECPSCHSREHIKYVCSFTWTMRRHLDELMRLVSEKNKEKVVVDEYGEEFTAEEFLSKELNNCVITNQDFARFC